MWSMGVVVYVSLSGVFPFEEDRGIYEQIRNSNFMFPADQWKHISKDGELNIKFYKLKLKFIKIFFFKAIDLIKNEFLKLSINRRALVPKALKHKWFSEVNNNAINL